MGQLAQTARSRQLKPMARPDQQLKDIMARNWPRIAQVIGNNMSPERLYQLCVSTINREPKLAECTVESVLSCFMKCSALGLEPSTVDGLGKAYILPYGNKNLKGQKEATFILGYKGMLELARRSGELKSIDVQAVFKGDDFKLSKTSEGTKFSLTQDFGAPHSKDTLQCVYVDAHFNNGGSYFEVMTKAEIDTIMRTSPSFKSSTSPWKTHYVEMARKTALRHAFKMLPVSVNAQNAAAADDTTPDYSDVFRPIIEHSTDQVIAAEAHPVSEDATDEPPAAQDDLQKSQPDNQTDTPVYSHVKLVDDMYAAFSNIGVEDAAVIRATVNRVAGKAVKSPLDLSEDEIRAVIEDTRKIGEK